MDKLDLAKNFPELNDGQLRMLERYIAVREAAAAGRADQSD